jgi:hypothetical protein
MRGLLGLVVILIVLLAPYAGQPTAQSGFDLKAALATVSTTGGVLDLRQQTGEIVVNEPLYVGVTQQGPCVPIVGAPCPRGVTVLFGTVLIRLVGRGQLRLGSSSAIVGSGAGGYATAIQVESDNDGVVIDAADGGAWARVADLDIHTIPSGDSISGKALIRITNSPFNRIENVSLWFNGVAQYGLLIEGTAAQNTHVGAWYNRVAQLAVQYQTIKIPPVPLTSVGVAFLGSAPITSQHVGDVSYNYLQLQNVEAMGVGLLFSNAHHNTVMGGHLLGNTLNISFQNATHNTLFGIKGNQPLSGEQVRMSGSSYFNAFYSPSFSLPHLLGPNINRTTTVAGNAEMYQTLPGPYRFSVPPVVAP